MYIYLYKCINSPYFFSIGDGDLTDKPLIYAVPEIVDTLKCEFIHFMLINLYDYVAELANILP